jgi:nitrous oxidase accessory protein NosD
MKRLGLTLALAAATMAVLATPALAKTHDVWPGHSIQKAVNHARPGDTVLVHHGTYHQTVAITKNDINLVGRDVTLLPPVHPTGLCAQVTAPTVTGICVFGAFDSQGNPDPSKPARGNRITGFHVEHFSGEGIFLFNVADTTIVRDVAAWNGDYGIVGFVQHGGRYLWNVSHDNAAPGFYLGDSPHADYVIAHNVSFGNEFGIFVRHSAHGVVRDNQVWGNCIGVFFLDDGQPGGEHDLVLSDNRSWANDKACAASDEGPAVSGVGVLFLGAQHSVARDNVIRNNVASGPSPFSGGFLLLSAKPFSPTGHNPAFDRITRNHLSGNQPDDIIWDGTGAGNAFSGNSCSTSSPGWICS